MIGSWAVVCDFDGTATVEDLADALSIRYVGVQRWQEANERFQRGDIPFIQLLREIFEPITATPDEVRAFVHEHVRFRAGLERLITMCRERSIPFVLASGGLDVYIRPALEMLPAALTTGLDLRANRATFTAGGLALTFPWQDAAGACGTCGSCKGAVVRELQSRGHRVIAVGDGNADRCAARIADAVFARARLLDWCRSNALPCRPFESLHAVADFLQGA